MASSVPLSEEDLLCPVCCEVFSFPVTLICGHNTCKICVQKYWEWKGSRECPVCRRRTSIERPPINLALKIASDSFKSLKQQRTVLDSDIQCTLHNEPLKLFCVIDEEPICVVCQTSKMHRPHLCCPVEEAALDRKREISTQLISSQKQLETLNTMRDDWIQTEHYIQDQADQTARQIKDEFGKLHTFLWDEEAARVSVLREEEVQKTQVVKEKLESITKKIATLSHAISDLQKAIVVDDVSFLQSFKQTKGRALNKTEEPEKTSGVLIDVSTHLGSLKFQVWKKVLETVQCSPVILDPNTAHPNLAFSHELSSVSYSGKQIVPNNHERCTSRLSVLGAKGFSSAKHCWVVEVGEIRDWFIGVARESIQRKKSIFLNPAEGFWVIGHYDGETYWAQTAPRTRLSLKRKPQQITVMLDYDKGKVVFVDFINMTPIYTFKHKFTEKLFPYLSPGVHGNGKNPGPLKICPLKVSVKTEQN